VKTRLSLIIPKRKARGTETRIFLRSHDVLYQKSRRKPVETSTASTTRKRDQSPLFNTEQQLISENPAGTGSLMVFSPRGITEVRTLICSAHMPGQKPNDNIISGP
jgi:hypothetical protein